MVNSFGQLSKRQVVFAVVATSVVVVSWSKLTTWRMIRKNEDHANVNKSIGRRKLQNQDFGVVWAMSYPQAGVTGILEFIHTASGTTTATNYGQATYDANNQIVGNMLSSIPVIPERINGPYRLANHLPLPPSRILTRTHCAGFCMDCKTRDYVPFLTRKDNFLSECVKSIRFSAATGKAETVKYSSELVKGIVLILRNPWENLISRFKHERRVQEVKSNRAFGERYPESPKGFQEWCSSLDWEKTNLDDERSWYETEEFSLGTFVPCHAEFYRMVKWHNMAFVMAEELNVPIHILHVEALKNDVPGVMNRLFDFLQIKDYDLGKLENFELEPSSAGEYFDSKQKSFGIEFVKRVASSKVRDAWRHYINL